MQRTTALCLAAVCFLSAGSAAHADKISYTFKPSQPSIFYQHGLGGVYVDGSGVLPSTSGTISSSLVTFSFAAPQTPQHVSIPISLKLSDSHGHSETLALGKISGDLSILNSSLSFTPSKQTFGSQQSFTTTFDNKNFTFSNASFSFKSGLLASQGTLSFHVVDPPANNGQSAPEPSSLLLAGIGVPLFGVFLRRRRA